MIIILFHIDSDFEINNIDNDNCNKIINDDTFNDIDYICIDIDTDNTNTRICLL